MAEFSVVLCPVVEVKATEDTSNTRGVEKEILCRLSRVGKGKNFPAEDAVEQTCCTHKLQVKLVQYRP